MGDSEVNAGSEYAALSAYFNVITTIRFTVLGALLAALALVATRGPISRLDGAGIAIVSLALWVMEMRSRAISRNLARRAVDIERGPWGIPPLEGFYDRQWKFDAESPAWDEVRVFGKRLAWRGRSVKVSYSVSFDTLFSLALAYGIYRAVRP